MTSVFIQSLADYNAGRIVGEWVDVEGMDEGELQDAINKVLAQSEEEVAEEWEFADYDGFYGLGLDGFSSIKRVIMSAKAIQEHGEPYTLYANHVGLEYATTQGFEDAYYGAWDSFKEFAEHLFDECYLSQVPESVRFYIDYDAFARDLELDYFHERGSDGQTHVFRCH
ncbi:MAG: antirestriction protein ArdA [Cyanobacteria bacterium J06631_2]